MAQYVAHLKCSQDTHVRSGYPNNNYGSSDTLSIAGNAGTAYLSFVGGEEKEVAGLSLSICPVSGSGEARLYIGDIPVNLGDFEHDMTYNNRPLSVTFAQKTEQILSRMIINLYTLFNGNINKINNVIKNGVALYTTTSMNLRSREYSDASAPELIVTYADAIPYKPVAQYPNTEAIDSGSEIRLGWDYRPAFGIKQRYFVVEWRPQGEMEWNQIMEHTQNEFCSVPRNTFPTGNIEWRVKTVNERDEISPYSDTLTFYSVGKPVAPTVNVDISARPVIKWSALEQKLWQVQIIAAGDIIYNSGTKSGDKYQFKIDQFLGDGRYTARVRVQSAYNIWSDWGSYIFDLITEKPEVPILTVASNSDFSLSISVETSTEVTSCLLYRRELEGHYILLNGIENHYTDNTPASGVKYEYMARAVLENDSFADSNPVIGELSLSCSVISCDNIHMPLMYRLESGYHRHYSISSGKNLENFVGREHPVVTESGFKEKQLNLDYFILHKELRTILELSSAPTVLYRNETGEKFWGTVLGFSFDEHFRGENKGYNISFSLNKIDYKEGVDMKQALTLGNGLPAGGAEGQVLLKTGPENYKCGWAYPAETTSKIPEGGTTGQVLMKMSEDDYDVGWTAASGVEIITGGYLGNGVNGRTVVLGYRPKTLIVSIADKSPFTFSASQTMIRCGFATDVGASIGLELSDDGFVVYHPAGTPPDAQTPRFNSNGENYFYIATR